MKKNIEIELKFPLLNMTETEAYLDSNAKFIYESFQHDIYLNPPHRNFVKDVHNICEWLRLRIAGDTVQINYKDWQPHNEKIKTHCIEYETKVDSYDQLKRILTALDFVDLVEVKKKRKSWLIEQAEVSIDQIEGLGEFIEIEYKGNSGSIHSIRKYLHTLIHKIGASTKEIDLKGYPFLLLERRGLE